MNEHVTQHVGQSYPRREAREKVTGRIEYIHNLRLPNMLYGKIFRSTIAHGRIAHMRINDMDMRNTTDRDSSFDSQ